MKNIEEDQQGSLVLTLVRIKHFGVEVAVSPLSCRFPGTRILCCCRSILPALPGFVFDSTRRAARRIWLWPWACDGHAGDFAPSMVYILVRVAGVGVVVVDTVGRG
jgi:hypothetical protein